MNKISRLIVDILFPENLAEKDTEKIISGLAKLRVDNGDAQTQYPCPAYSFFAYRNQTVRSMIWRLKYKGNRKIANVFAKCVYDGICEELADLGIWSNFTNPILVGIPVSKKKLRTRGFSQTGALCIALEGADQDRFFNYIPNVLYKIKDTISQARVKDKKSRLQNLKDSFSIKDKTLVERRNIILLDDVLTTGSTLIEATRILKTAGAKNIIWLVIAH